jgi:hypothetical protein
MLSPRPSLELEPELLLPKNGIFNTVAVSTSQNG